MSNHQASVLSARRCHLPRQQPGIMASKSALTLPLWSLSTSRGWLAHCQPSTTSVSRRHQLRQLLSVMVRILALTQPLLVPSSLWLRVGPSSAVLDECKKASPTKARAEHPGADVGFNVAPLAVICLKAASWPIASCLPPAQEGVTHQGYDQASWR